MFLNRIFGKCQLFKSKKRPSYPIILQKLPNILDESLINDFKLTQLPVVTASSKLKYWQTFSPYSVIFVETNNMVEAIIYDLSKYDFSLRHFVAVEAIMHCHHQLENGEQSWMLKEKYGSYIYESINSNLFAKTDLKKMNWIIIGTRKFHFALNGDLSECEKVAQQAITQQ